MATALRIGVLGAGAIGCFVGGRLAANGADVVLVGRDRLKEELVASDLTLTDLEGAPVVVAKENVKVTTSVEDLADRDVVLVCVKSLQTAEVAAKLAHVLGDRSAIVVSLQNGVRNADVIRAHVSKQIVLGAIVGFNVVGASNGVFRRTTSGALLVEAHEDPRVTDLARALRAAGFDVDLTRDFRAQQWTKLVSNVNNAVGALSDVPTRDLIFTPGYRRIMRVIIAEAIDAMRAAGIRPAKQGPIPVGLFPLLLRLPTPILRVALRAQLKVDPEARSSMWQDLALGRATEVDDLNGEIVRLAEAHGARAPINRRIVELVHEVEAKKAGSTKMSAEALWRALT